MAASTTFTSVAALQGFVREFNPALQRKAFYGNQTASIATPHPNCKGKEVLTLLSMGNIGHRWAKAFTPNTGILTFSPRTLSLEKGTFEVEIHPQDFYNNYLGRFHNGTFTDVDSYPFEAYIMDALMEKMGQEIEAAWWRGDAAASPATADLLIAVIDGWLTKIADDQAAGTPVLTPYASGALTVSNTVQAVEGVFDTLDAVYQDMPIACFVSPKVWTLYQRQYRNDYSKFTAETQPGRMAVDFAPNCELIRTPGMGTSSRILMTPKENLHYGYDGVGDSTTFHFEQYERIIKMWCDFMFGVEFGFFENGILGINNQA